MLGFLGLSKIQLIVSAVVVALLLGALGVLWFQNKGLRTDLQTSQANVATAKAAIAQQAAAVIAAVANAKEWQEAFDGMEKRLEEMASAQREASSETRRLNTLFGKHDLTALARAKPGLIERRINAGSVDVFGVLKRISAGDIHKAGRPEASPKAPSNPKPATN